MVYQKTLERLERENWYLNSADYARYAQETFSAEKSVIERLGLRKQAVARSRAPGSADRARLFPHAALGGHARA